MNITDLPKDKHYRYFQAAYMAALLCPGIGGRHNNTFRLGSTLVYKRDILTVKNNNGKTHPGLLAFSKYPYLHAESSAIFSCGLDNCSDAIIYVLRILRNKEIAMAKPCHSCMRLIMHVGIKRVYYTTNAGHSEIIL